MLWWNEGNSVKIADMLEEAQGVCVEMENPNKKDASLEGQLVCGTAMTATTDLLTDKDFGFSVNAISMKRSVEYYQWDEKRTEETKQKLDGSEKKVVTYDYNLKWSSSPIGSKHFKEHSTHVNVVLAKFEDDEQWAEHVSFGAYNLNNSLIHSINAYEPLRPDMSDDCACWTRRFRRRTSVTIQKRKA